MDVISYTAARANLAATMQRVCDDHSPVIITRRNADPVVMISSADYSSFDETAYLLSNPHNADRLRRSIVEMEAGQVVERDFIE